MRFDGTHPKIVCHKDGVSTHGKRQDEFAPRSHTLACAGWESGFYRTADAPSLSGEALPTVMQPSGRKVV